MKKLLIILLISAIPFLLVVGFCGYHLYRVLSLDPGFFLSDEDFHSSEKALDMLIYSKHFPQGLACGEVPRYMREDNFDSLNCQKFQDSKLNTNCRNDT